MLRQFCASALSLFVEFSARSAIALSTINPRVLWRELVAAPTERLSQIGGRQSRAAQCIDPARNCLQVIRVNALGITAKMVNLQTFRNRAHDQFVGKPVHINRLTTNPDLSIAGLPSERALPNPATTFIDGYGLADTFYWRHLRERIKSIRASLAAKALFCVGLLRLAHPTELH